MIHTQTHTNTHTHTHTGTRFASGGADKTVIIWDAESVEGILKYTHTDSIQCLAYSTVSQQLLSCTSSDIGWLIMKGQLGARVMLKPMDRWVTPDHSGSRPPLYSCRLRNRGYRPDS